MFYALKKHNNTHVLELHSTHGVEAKNPKHITRVLYCTEYKSANR
jgi:hypothetical protein